MTATPRSSAQDIADLALFTARDITHALTGAYVCYIADFLFTRLSPEAQKVAFLRNPATTLPYLALRALEEQARVRIEEVLRDADNAESDGYDFALGQIWDMQRSINEELTKNNQPLDNETIPITPHMAEMLHLIMDLSLRPEAPRKPSSELLEYLEKQAPKFQAFLGKQADGQRDPVRDLERAEKIRLRKIGSALAAATRARNP